MRKLTRRGFLIGVAAAPVAAGLAGCGGSDGNRVLVIGGGLCGLVALDRLVKAGRKAALLEAGTRLGGRIYTVRGDSEVKRFPDAKFSPGLRAELGAERVGLEDHGMRALLAELGLATVSYTHPSQPMAFHWAERVFRFDDGRDLPEAVTAGLSDVEKKASPLGILHALVEGAPAPANDDPRTGLEWLRSRGMTPAGENFVRAFAPMPIADAPAAVFHRMALREIKARRSELVKGGTDQIVEKLAARHAGAISKGVAAVSLRQDGNRVEILDSQGRKHEGSSAIVCLPLTPLRKLQFEGGVPKALAERLDTLQPAHERKLATESSNAEVTWVFAERNVRWRLPETSASGSFVSQTLQWEAEVRMADGEHGLMASAFKDFGFDPLIGAAYAYSKSGTAREGVVPAGRIIFAGADLSDMPGWMEGAVRAAEQAVAALPG